MGGFLELYLYIALIPYILLGAALYYYLRQYCALNPDPFDLTLTYICLTVGGLLIVGFNYLLFVKAKTGLTLKEKIWTFVGSTVYLSALAVAMAVGWLLEYNPVEQYDQDKLRAMRYLGYAMGGILALPLLIGFLIMVYLIVTEL